LPYQREAAAVLADWRGARRDLRAVEADVPPTDELVAEMEDLQDEMKRLRAEYDRLTQAALRNERPVPAPFPDPH
jgi:hypothetical protein